MLKVRLNRERGWVRAGLDPQQAWLPGSALPPLFLHQLFCLHLEGLEDVLVGLLLLLVFPHLLLQLLLEQHQLFVGHLDQRQQRTVQLVGFESPWSEPVGTCLDVGGDALNFFLH